jgi:hypothetical protein
MFNSHHKYYKNSLQHINVINAGQAKVYILFLTIAPELLCLLLFTMTTMTQKLSKINTIVHKLASGVWLCHVLKLSQRFGIYTVIYRVSVKQEKEGTGTKCSH